jgi:hypothetical protein
VLRWLPSALLLVVLGSCSVFHPYRLPTPKPSPEFKAQQKAAASARKKRESNTPLFKKKPNPADEEAATDVSTPSGAPLASTAATPEARTLPERPTVRYDKQGLMKKPKLMRRRRTKPSSKPFRPWKSIRHFFKYDLHAKPNYSPDHRPVAPAADPAPDAAPVDVEPAPAPAAKP